MIVTFWRVLAHRRLMRRLDSLCAAARAAAGTPRRFEPRPVVPASLLTNAVVLSAPWPPAPAPTSRVVVPLSPVPAAPPAGRLSPRGAA